jgi:RNA polymerase sigma factor (TIGR02999 family)
MVDPNRNLTQVLGKMRDGDRAAHDQLIALVYEELKSIARRYASRARPGATLQPTALVNEAYLRLVDAAATPWQNRAHFFGVAALAMRQIVANHVRASRAEKRGGRAPALPITLMDNLVATSTTSLSLDLVHDALHKLEQLDGRQSKIVECRFFGGMSNEEIAEFVGVSPSTVDREWRAARAWLRGELRDASGP